MHGMNGMKTVAFSNCSISALVPSCTNQGGGIHHIALLPGHEALVATTSSGAPLLYDLTTLRTQASALPLDTELASGASLAGSRVVTDTDGDFFYFSSAGSGVNRRRETRPGPAGPAPGLA